MLATFTVVRHLFPSGVYLKKTDQLVKSAIREESAEEIDGSLSSVDLEGAHTGRKLASG